MQINQETFEAWLFAQPDERKYNYLDNNNCLICRFVKETTNIQDISAGGDYLRYNNKIFKFEGWLLTIMNTWNPNIKAGVPSSKDFGTVKKLYIDFFPATFASIEANGTSTEHKQTAERSLLKT